MAYALKILLEHHDTNDALNRIEIEERDYAGEIDQPELEGDEPATLTTGDTSNTLPTIYGTELRVKFLCATDFKYLDLYTNDARRYRVTKKIAGQVVFKGFVTPENYSEPYTKAPYFVEATATDGLGNLKDTKFTDENGDEYEGRCSIVQLLALILKKTGLELNINIATTITEATQGTGTDYTAANTIDAKTYAGKNCYEILEDLFRGSRIMQRMGEWWVISYDNFQNNSIAYRKYNATANYLYAGTISLLAADFWIENEPELAMEPAAKQMKLTQPYGYNANLVTNGSFSKYNAELNKFETWINNGGVLPLQYVLNKDGDKYVYIPGQQYPGRFGDGGYGGINKYLSKRLPIRQTNSILKLALDYALMGSSKSCYMFIRLLLIGSTETYYLRYKPYTDATTAEFVWRNDAWNFGAADKTLCLKSHLEVSHASLRTGKYYNTFDKVDAYPADKITEHFEKFTASVEGVPISGQLELQLLVPYTDRSEIGGTCFTSVQFELLDEQNEQYPEKMEFEITNDINNNYSPEDVEQLMGDYPDVINYDIIYTNGIQNPSGARTTAWSLPGSASYTYAELIGRLIVAMQASPRQKYNIRLTDITPGLNMIIVDELNSNRRFLETGMTYYSRMQAIEGSYVEVLTVNIDSLTVKAAEDLAKLPESTAVEIPAQTENIDARVELLDTAGAKVSQPAFMYANDFELKTTDPESLDEDGKARIQIRRAAVAPYNLDQAAGQLQFSLTSVCEMNYNNDANQVKFNAGQFLIHNWNALAKDERLIALES